MNKKENTAKNFVIQLGSLITLYVSLSALIILIFGVINIRFPEEALYIMGSEGAREGIRTSIAMLVIFFPTYLVLTRFSNKSRRKEENGLYTGIAKWLVFLSLLVGGLIIMGDLVTVLVYLLNGEITSRFILKALTLLVVIGVTFTYYLLDARGYFKAKEKDSILFGAGVTFMVIISLIGGFLHIETPSEVREMRIDQQQVEDLQDMQWRIEDYYRTSNSLPAYIDELYLSNGAPQSPSGRDAYQYKITGETAYELCATFANTSASNNKSRYTPNTIGQNNYNWEYEKGTKCFQRVSGDIPVKELPTVLKF